MKNSLNGDNVYNFPDDDDDDEDDNEYTGREKNTENKEKKKRKTVSKSKRGEQNGKGATKGNPSKGTRPLTKYLTQQNSMEEHLKELGIDQGEVDRMGKAERQQLIQAFKESKASCLGGSEQESENLPINSTSATGASTSSTSISTTSVYTMEQDIEPGESVSSICDQNIEGDIELATTDDENISEASEQATNTLNNDIIQTSITMQSVVVEHNDPEDIEGDNRLMSKRIKKLAQFWNRHIAEGRENKQKKSAINNDSDIISSHKQSQVSSSESEALSSASSSVCINGRSLKIPLNRRPKPIWTFSAWGPPYGLNGLTKKPLPAFGGITRETLHALSYKEFSPPPIPVFSDIALEESSFKGWPVRDIKPMNEDSLKPDRPLQSNARKSSNQGEVEKENEVDFFNNEGVNGVIRKGPKRTVKVEGRKRIQISRDFSDSEDDFCIAETDSNRWMSKGEGMKQCITYRGKRNKKKDVQPEESDGLPDLVIENDSNFDGPRVSDGEEMFEAAKNSAPSGRPQRQCRQKRAAVCESGDSESDGGAATKKRSRKKVNQERNHEMQGDIASHFIKRTGAETATDDARLFKSKVVMDKQEYDGVDAWPGRSGHAGGVTCDKSVINYESLPADYIRYHNTRGVVLQNEAKPSRNVLRVSLPIPVVINLCKDEVDHISPTFESKSESHMQTFNCGQSTGRIGSGGSGFPAYQPSGISMRLSEYTTLQQSTREMPQVVQAIQAAQAMPVQRSNSKDSTNSSDSDVICSSNPSSSTEAKFYTSGNSTLNMKQPVETKREDNSKNNSKCTQQLSRPPLRMSENKARNEEEIAKGPARSFNFRKMTESNLHKADNDGGTQQCPICNQIIHVSIIQEHANSCIDSLNQMAKTNN